jgi:hypothetical protein
VLIDWRNSDVGPGGIDEALTGLIIAQVAVSPIAEAALANGVLDAYLTLIGRLDPSDCRPRSRTARPTPTRPPSRSSPYCPARKTCS